MGRYKAVDPDQVLDAAEALIRDVGIDALTFDAVAKAAGISKGGVQSSFGTKSGLIKAMFDRCATAFEASVAVLAGEAPTPQQFVHAYVEASRRMDQAYGDRMASLMTALLSFPEQKKTCQDWYRRQLAPLDLGTPEGRRARLALMANEGVCMLRFLGFMAISPTEWHEVFDDLHTLLETPEALRRAE